MSEFNVYRDGHKMRDEIAELRAELTETQRRNAVLWSVADERKATIARVRAVITDHECCNCLVRADGCEHMWNEMREVFRPTFDGGTE